VVGFVGHSQKPTIFMFKIKGLGRFALFAPEKSPLKSRA
jgi:hypothetical protein